MTDRSCAVPRTHNTFDDRSFAAAGSRLWNSLPVHLLDELDVNYNSFQRELKTFWF